MVAFRQAILAMALLTTPLELGGQDSAPVTASGPNSGEAELDNGIYVRDSGGNLLPRADVKTRQLSSGRTIVVHDRGFTRRRVLLKPGDQLQDFMFLNRLYDLSKPGPYTIVLKKEIPLDRAVPEPTRITLSSNTLQITVTGHSDIP
jgi:hypothetical protein